MCGPLSIEYTARKTMIEISLLLFVIGLSIGSFLNVVIYRLVNQDSPLRGRSYCDFCKSPIAWYDNIPLLSFLLLRRKCRSCAHPISWQYPMVEFLTGALFVWWYIVGFTFFQLGSGLTQYIQPLFWLAIGVLFVVVVFADISYYLIPDSATLLLTILSFSYRLYLVGTGVMRIEDFWMSLVAAVGASLFVFGLFLITRGKGMGFGDVKLLFPLGLITGFPNIVVAFFAACVTGAIGGMVLQYVRSKKVTGMVPFGPFLILGTILALLWGDSMIRWYRGFL